MLNIFKPSTCSIPTWRVCCVSLLRAVSLHAQVTVNANPAGSSGMTMTEGVVPTGITSSQDAIFASSTLQRVAVLNHGATTSSPLAVWPCDSTKGVGCISYSSGASFGETALSLGSTLGIPLLVGSGAPQWGGSSANPYWNLQQIAIVSEYVANSTSPPQVNKLVTFTPVSGSAQARLANSTTGSIEGICLTNCSAGSTAQIGREGTAACTFDTAPTAGNYVQASQTNAGNCVDAGNVYPYNGMQVLGRVLSSAAVSGSNYLMTLYAPGQTPSWNITSGKTPVVKNSLTLQGVDGKTLTVNNNLTFQGTDGSTLSIGGGGTLGTGAYANISNYAPLAGATFTGAVVTAASSSSGTGLNLPPGSAPTSPSNGDCWTTSSGFSCRINGTTATVVPPTSTVGVGGVWVHGVPLGMLPSSTTITPVHGTTYFTQLPLQAQQTIGHFTADVTTPGGTLEILYVCIYDPSGNFAWSANTSVAGSNGVSGSATQYAALPGVYTVVWEQTASSGSTAAIFQGISQSSAVANILNKNGSRMGTFGVGISSGCGSTLSSLGTATGIQIVVPLIALEP